MLREQLDQAHLANQQLTADVRRLNTELQQVREEFTKTTRSWKEEERVRFFYIYLIILSIKSRLYRCLIDITIMNIILFMNYGVT